MQLSTNIMQWIYNRQTRRILGRDGKQWSRIRSLSRSISSSLLLGQLAAFYFFFYVTLGGLFCLYLAVFMSFLPLNQPRYTGEDSQITSRSHPLSPGLQWRLIHMSNFILGLSFRPQISSNLHDVQVLISLSTDPSSSDRNEIYTKNLDEFLQRCKWWKWSSRSENVRLLSQILVLQIRRNSPLQMLMIVNRTNSTVLPMGNRVF